VSNSKFELGLELLRQPVLPLVSMVEFFAMTGSFSSVQDIINELPQPIETKYTIYKDPAVLLAPYLDLMEGLIKSTSVDQPIELVNENNEELDPMVVRSSWIKQQILTLELEKINSALCGPCNCTLCCTGPQRAMQQEFFEIPLKDGELNSFEDCSKIDSEESRTRLPMDEDELVHDGLPFWASLEPNIIHWKNGWSLILPKKTSCPNLILENGRCRTYDTRPLVCRRPQIFPYIMEQLDDHNSNKFRLRNIILAITDCPYVTELQDEITGYIAACELEPIFMRNKQ